MSKSNFSYDLLPQISNINNQACLEQYLAELLEAKNLNIFESENLLIYGSLHKSKKIDIYLSLTEAEKLSIDLFGKHLRHNYGSTEDEKRAEYATLQQKDGESPPEFLRRLERNYFQLKGLSVPSQLEEYEKSDIKWTYISGLANPEVKKHMLLKDSTYETLGVDARKIEKQLNGLYHKNIYTIKNSETDDALLKF